MSEMPIGCIFCYPSPICPEGFLPCDGRELSKKVYSELYALIGDTWGEPPSTFFLPDLRGQFVRGWDDGEGVDPDSGADSIRKLGSEQLDTFQGHCHDLIMKGRMTESDLFYEHHNIIYGKHFFRDNQELSFNSILTPSEKDEKVKLLKRQKKTHGTMFKTIFGDFAEKLIKNIGLRHNHKLPNIEVTDATSSTFQKVRTSVETRPKNIALIYCIKVK